MRADTLASGRMPPVEHVALLKLMACRPQNLLTS